MTRAYQRVSSLLRIAPNNLLTNLLQRQQELFGMTSGYASQKYLIFQFGT
jgi:hypothetical protein